MAPKYPIHAADALKISSSREVGADLFPRG
jgi:hypothetical protein